MVYKGSQLRASNLVHTLAQCLTLSKQVPNYGEDVRNDGRQSQLTKSFLLGDTKSTFIIMCTLYMVIQFQ